MSRDEALRLDYDGKLEYWKNVRVKHPRVMDVLDSIELLTFPHCGTDIALLIGPTGVGKSGLTLSLHDRILESKQQAIKDDPSYIPVVWVEAPASGELVFSWRVFYTRLAERLHEPLTLKRLTEAQEDGRMIWRSVVPDTVAGLRVALEPAFKNRRTGLVIVDEAVHILRHAKGDKLTGYMEALKSLSNVMTWALVGSYDLFQVLSLNGQLARRSAVVHFARYDYGKEDDRKAFRKVVATLQKLMPIEQPPDLEPLAADLHQACLGNVGIFKETLSRALKLTLKNGGHWDHAYLEKALLSKGQLAIILDETLEGEARIAESIFGEGHFARAASAKAA